jgi:serine/threonine-protein kinase RsbW
MEESLTMSSEVFHHSFERDGLALKLKARLAADQKAVDAVVQRIMQLVRKMECAAGKEDAIELALTEALVNAVVHGAKSDPSKSIECDVACEEKSGMVIVVRDPGEGFDPAVIPSPVTGENIYSSHGRGIFLINQLMDDVKFHKNGTEIHMIKRFKPVRSRKTLKPGKTSKAKSTRRRK